MSEVLTMVKEIGTMGAVVVVLLYQIVYLQKKLVAIIENNTKAMAELKLTIERFVIYRDQK